MQMKVKPMVVALMLSVGATGSMVQTADAAHMGRKILGAVVVGGIAHHYYKKHKMHKREERIREDQRRMDYQQSHSGTGYGSSYNQAPATAR